MNEEQFKKILYIAVAQLAKRVEPFDDDEELAMETQQFGDIEFTQDEVKTALIKTNANYQEVIEDEGF